MKDLDISLDTFQENTKRLLLAAGKPEYRRIKVLEGGYVNKCYLLELSDDSKLVMKVWTNKNTSLVKQVIRNTFYLAKHGLSTPLPLLLNEDERLIILD